MAFRSLAQMEKFKQLVADGKMSQQTFTEWAKGTIVETLPQRIGKHSPEPIEHVNTERRHARKQRKKRTRRTIPTGRKQRVKRKQPSKRKPRMMPL